ncbi:auracyanin [Chloroflexia bacterium SDU3-3]|nr:auracyanin [Chloroflexia bacterium SDU3-3]
MFSKVRTLMAGVAVVGAFALSACGGGGGGGGGGGLTLDTGDAISFKETSLSAAANTPVTLTYNNKSAGLQHNFVLVKGGDDVAAEVNTAGQGEADYVPKGNENVLAAGTVLDSGKSETINIPALPAGTYTYICTFPAHYDAGMKGTLTVK